MVRAAATRAIDYSLADPKDINWRIRHQLIIREIQRTEERYIVESAHRHWLAYVSHGNLTAESFTSAKQNVSETIDKLQHVVFPWLTKPEKEAQKNTIDDATAALVERYKTYVNSVSNGAE